MPPMEIDPASWSQLNRLLDEALDKRPAERAAWLEALGAEHDALKPQLRELLARGASVETGDFLATLPKFQAAGFADGPAAGEAGDVIGPYRLVRELGRGGMGSVWLAERVDGLINRPVALKLPHLLASPSAGLAERMAREREILATLDHRNIARLLDAGISAGGQPFLALEYVEGVPIDQYCANQDMQARIRLFRQVADAVAYAHGKLVIHRDLKPANILVTPGGGVKLLDFGIAKLLDEGQARATRLTELSGRALTPDYASPEQILGEPLTVATDVYSLGVVLYELLASARPYRLKRDSRGALEDAIVQSEPQRPSDVAPPAQRRTLRGDLDNIALRALKKSAHERYATVNEFSDDLTRYLEDRPVRARADSGWYRLRKFVARNSLWVGASAAMTLAVLAGAGVAAWQAVEASAQRDAALNQQRRAEAYSDFMRVLLQDSSGAPGGQPMSTPQLLDRGVAMLERQSGLDDSVSAYIWYELSRNYLLFVNVKRELELLDRAVAGAQRIGDYNLLAAAHCSAAWTQAHSTQDDPRPRLMQGRDALQRVAEPADYAVMDCTRAEGRVLQAEGDMDGALRVLLAGRERLVNTRERKSWRNDVLATQLAEVYRATDRFKEALVLSAESLRAVRESGRSGSLAELVSLNNHAGNLCRLGEVSQCAQIGEEILAWAVRTDARNPPVGLKSNVGNTFLRMGQVERALTLANEDALLARAANNQNAIAMSNLLAAKALSALGRGAEARERISAAETLWNSNPKAYSRMLLESRLVHADIDVVAGDLAAAQARIIDALQTVRYPQEKRAPGLDRLLRQAARVNLAHGDAHAALGYATDARAVSAGIARDLRASADVGLAALLRAESLDALGRRTEAIQEVELAVAALANGLGAGHAETLRARALAESWGGSS
jgi:eukaryotic-like serine/threonine-protein kinase